MRLRWLALVPLLGLAAACAESGSAAGGPAVAATSPHVGRSEAELLRARGVPARTTEAGGSRFLVYETGGGGGWGGPSVGVGVGGGSGGSGVGIGLGFPIFGGGSRGCATTYEVRDGTVIGARSQPEGCE